HLIRGRSAAAGRPMAQSLSDSTSNPPLPSLSRVWSFAQSCASIARSPTRSHSTIPVIATSSLRGSILLLSSRPFAFCGRRFRIDDKEQLLSLGAQFDCGEANIIGKLGRAGEALRFGEKGLEQFRSR